MRVALVLGAGGISGGAFHAGVLAALQQELGWDARRADLVIGTSAGSMTGAALRAGLAPRDLFARATGGALSREGQRLVQSMPPAPMQFPLRRDVRAANLRRGPAAAGSLARMALSRASVGAMAAAILPRGTIPIADLAAGFDPMFRNEWPDDPLWICAVSLTDGRRVVFGRDGTDAPVAQAVAASCAIPGFFSPVTIDGRDHVDGGVHSPTNLDLVARDRYDLVVVSSPMSIAGRGVRVAGDTPIRRACRVILDREAFGVRRRGTPVVAFQPTAADAAVMGVNAMDVARRGAVAHQVYESTLKRLATAETRRRLDAIAR